MPRFSLRTLIVVMLLGRLALAWIWWAAERWSSAPLITEAGSFDRRTD
jgi:hypothetical protein